MNRVNNISLVLITVCLLLLNDEAKVIHPNSRVLDQRHNKNLGDSVFNEKGISEGQQKKYSHYGHRPILRKRQDDAGRVNDQKPTQEQLLFYNESDYGGHPPYAIGLNEALIYRQQYFLTPNSERNPNNVHVKAHKVKMLNGHHIVAHHLKSKQNFDKNDGQLGNKNKSLHNLIRRNVTQMGTDIKDGFMNFGEKMMNFFGRNPVRENELQVPARSNPKHRKRSENVNRKLLRQPGTYETTDETYNNEKDNIIHSIPRIHQISLNEKSSGKFNYKAHMICEKDENSQQVQCRNSKTKVSRNEEDSVLHSNPKTMSKFEKHLKNDYPLNYDSFTDLY